MKNNIVKKGLAFGIIVLFIGVGIAPSVTSIEFSKNETSKSNDLVEITLQLCKSDGVEDHKVFITKEQDEELDLLIEGFKENLNNAETREETIEIYNDMIVSLDELRILPECTNYKEVQELVTGENSISNPEKMKSTKQFEVAYEKLKNKNIGLEDNENMFCLISGETTRTETVGLTAILCGIHIISLFLRWVIIHFTNWYIFGSDFLNTLVASIYMVRSLFWLSIAVPINFQPLKLGGFLTFGFSYYEDLYQEPEYRPAKGGVYTNGLNGIKRWNGSFFGNIFSLPSLPFSTHYVGAIGFTGIKINNFFQGSALWVKLGPGPL